MSIPFFESWIGEMSEAASLPPDLVKLAICMGLSYPFCAILKRLPDNRRNLKSLYCVAIFNLYAGTRTLLISTLATYFMTKYWKSPLMPWGNFLFVLGHLFINHISAQISDDFDVNVIDITGAQMVLCMKLSSFGWNVYDGQQSDDDRKVVVHPDFIDFLAYAFFFPSLLVGPSYDYAEFSRWIDLSMFDVTINDPAKGRHKKRRIPRSGRVAAVRAFQGILWIVLWIQITKYISLEYAQSSKFMTISFWKRIHYLWALGFTYRLKYYGAWYISEGACILSGLGFNGKDANGKYRWDRVRNVDPWAFETGQNTHALLEAWNMNTNRWLKNYIYLRVTPRGRKPGLRSTLATFLTSAIWHGTRPGYYLTFITGALFQSLGKLFRRNIRPIFLKADRITPGPYKVYYDTACYFVTQLAFGYATQPFVLLDLKPSMAMWASVYFYVHVIMISILVLFRGPSRKLVLAWLKSKQPTPLTASEKIKLDAQRLKAIKLEIEELSSNQPSLGVPQPDLDNFDEDVKEAIQEFEELKSEISQELEKLRRTA